MSEHKHFAAVKNRLARAGGHLAAVARMVEEGRDCREILLQLSAVKAQLSNIGKIILKDHLEHCIFDAVSGKEESLSALEKAIDRLL